VVRHGPSRCLGAKEAWASSGCSVLTLYVSDDLGLDRSSSGEPSRVFLVVKEVSSGGYRMGPECPTPPEAVGSFVFLCHALNMTLLEK
jgi:hypothetical protein